MFLRLIFSVQPRARMNRIRKAPGSKTCSLPTFTCTSGENRSWPDASFMRVSRRRRVCHDYTDYGRQQSGG